MRGEAEQVRRPAYGAAAFLVAIWITLLGALMLRKEPVEARGTGPGQDIYSAGT